MGTSQAAWFGVSSLYLDSVSHGTGLKAALSSGGNWWYVDAVAPYNFIIDLKRSYTVTKVRGRSLRSVDPIDVDIYVSDSKTVWGSAVATGISTWQDTAAWVEIDTTDKKGRYVKVVVNDSEISNYLEWGGNGAPIFDVYCTDLPDCAEVCINLMNKETAGSDAANYIDTNFRIPWDGSKYDTLETAQFVVNAYGGGGDPAGTVYLELYDFTNSTSLAQVSAIQYGATYDEDNISMPAGAAEIGVRIKGTASEAIRQAQINLKIRAPANEGDIKVRVIRDVGWRMPDRTMITTSYVEHGCKRLRFDSSKYDGTITYYFGGYGKVPAGSTGYTELWNRTDSSQLSELTWTETSYTYKTSASISPTTEKEYTTRVKFAGFLGSFTPRCAHLIIDCVGLSKYEFDYLMASDRNISVKFSTGAYVQSANICGYQNKGLGITKVLIPEACAKKSEVDTGSLKVYDDNSAMGDSQIDFVAASYARLRNSTGMSEPGDKSGIECTGKGYTSSGTLQVDCHRFIVEVSNFDKSPSAGTNYQINIGDAWKDVSAMKINIGDTWKDIAGAQVNIGDAWKTIF